MYFYTAVEKFNLIFVFYDDQHLFYLSTVAQKSQLHLFYFINHSGAGVKLFLFVKCFDNRCLLLFYFQK